MARRFFYVSLGILALALAWHLGARSARADWDQGGLGCVMGGAEKTFYSATGGAYVLENNGTWLRIADRDLPVPASEVSILERVEQYNQYILITPSGEAWTWANGWTLIDPFSGCSGTSTEKSSWGGIKKQFKK